MNIVNRNRISPRRAAASFLAGCFIAAAGAATVHAEPATAAANVVVRYDAGTLATRGGALALFRRIDQAARSVCGEGATRDLGAVARVRECRKESVARAVRSVNDPRLAELMVRDQRRG
jgi:UrcA family protein